MKQLPCKTCVDLSKPFCKDRLIKTSRKGLRYLIFEYATKCPHIVDYLGRDFNGKIMIEYSKIYKLCDHFDATTRHFVWSANSIGNY